MKFVYPVEPRNGTKTDYLKGASNQTGFYPIGRLNTWHGGIHYEHDGSIKAIADGVLIAFRVPEDYQTETVNGKISKYSNSFVLIQHEYKSPNGQLLTFYSLYNHLSIHGDIIGAKIPNIFKVKKFTVKDYNIVKGTRIRKEAKTGKNILAVAKKGTELTIVSEGTTPANWLKVKYTTPKGKEITGYTYTAKYGVKERIKKKGNNKLEVLLEVNTGPNGDEGTYMYEKADEKSDVVEFLSKDTVISLTKEDQDKTSGFVKVVKVGNKWKSGYINAKGFISEDVSFLHDDYLNNVIKDFRTKISAGDIIGYSGYNGFGGRGEHKGVHVEIFAPDDVTDFLTNAKGDGEEDKNFTKLTEGTELDKKLPLSINKNIPVRKTGKTTDSYTEVEIDNLQLVVDNRDTQLPKTYSSKIYTFSEASDKTINEQRLVEFNKIVGDIAQMGDIVHLEKQLEGTQRRVTYYTPNKGLRFWAKNEDLEEKTLTFTIQTNTNATSQTTATSTATTQSSGVSERGSNVTATDTVTATQTTEQANTQTTTETKTYFRLNKNLSEIYLISPENDRIYTKLETDLIVNIKNGKTYIDNDDNVWYLLEPEGLMKNGIIKQYKGLIKKDDLEEVFSAYNWDKFGFEVKEDSENKYIYDFDNKGDFFTGICQLVDEDGDGVLEPYEFQNVFKDHYKVNKLSHLVCKHQNEWSYMGDPLNTLISEAESFYDKEIEKAKNTFSENGSELANEQELNDAKDEYLDRLKAKAGALAMWSDIETEEDGFWTKLVENSIYNNPVTQGGYLIYEGVRWVLKQASPESASEKSFKLIPFPVSNPVVYHFHPVAFVEQMRRMEKKLIFPLSKIPLNHPQNFKNSDYKQYDYTIFSKTAAPFGQTRNTDRLHAACDLYGTSGEPILAIADGTVISVSFFYYDTYQITIEHDFEIVKGHKLVVRYGEVHKNNILVKTGQKVKQGQKIAEMGLLIPYVYQPYPDKRGMLHFEMYTGEATGNLSQDVEYDDMLYYKSDDERLTSKSNYYANRKFKRRKDLINPLYYLNEMIKNL